MRTVSGMRAGRGGAIVFAVVTVVLAGWLVLSAPVQTGRLSGNSNPDAGMQIADPGWGGNGGG